MAAAVRHVLWRRRNSSDSARILLRVVGDLEGETRRWSIRVAPVVGEKSEFS